VKIVRLLSRRLFLAALGIVAVFVLTYVVFTGTQRMHCNGRRCNITSYLA
jgi:hypothetical protein